MTYFREVQPLSRNPVTWLMAFASGLLVVVPLSLPELREHMPASFALLLAAPVAGLLWLFAMRLETEVRDEGLKLYFRFAWFPKTYSWEEVERVESAEYKPKLELRRREWTWMVWGRRAIRVHLRDGQTFLLGSTVPDRLEAAIRDRLAARACKRCTL